MRLLAVLLLTLAPVPREYRAPEMEPWAAAARWWPWESNVTADYESHGPIPPAWAVGGRPTRATFAHVPWVDEDGCYRTAWVTWCDDPSCPLCSPAVYRHAGCR